MRALALTAASLISGAAIAGSAAAAPQALLLAGAGSELQLYCEGGECAAEAGTICLQPERDNPDRGTAYTIPGGGLGTGDGLSLIGHLPDGREVAQRRLGAIARHRRSAPADRGRPVACARHPAPGG